MKSPIITRKRYNTDIREKENMIALADHKIERLEHNLRLASRTTNEILPHLVRINKPVEDKKFNTYRVCVDFHRSMVERCFTHGGDDEMIEYFADVLSHQIKIKMIRFNFARCDRR